MNNKNKSMAAAWDAMSPDEHKTWYKKNTADALQDTNDDSVMHQVNMTESEISSSTAINRGIPYAVYEDRCLQKGWPVERIMGEWRKKLVDPMIKKVKFNGETLVVEFLGLDFKVGSQAKVSAGTSRSAVMGKAEDLEAAREKAEKLLQDTRVSNDRRFARSCSQIPLDAFLAFARRCACRLGDGRADLLFACRGSRLLPGKLAAGGQASDDVAAVAE
jgi:hypothetical protein